jgi:di/tricarboxylate transporter
MSWEILLLCGLLLGALASFVFQWLPLEVTAMTLLAVLLLTGLVSAEEALAGLSDKAVVTVGAMLVLSHALVKTGLLEIAADRLSQVAGTRKWLGVAGLLAAASLMSGFLNNTAVVAILLPLAVDLCRRLGVSPSKVLIPLSYAAIFGGTLTLIGTSTNLLVDAVARRGGQRPLGMFEFLPLGAVFTVIGLTFVLTFGRRYLPDRGVVAALTRKYGMTEYLTELRVPQSSKLLGRRLPDSELGERYDITVLAIQRGEVRLTENLSEIELRPDDVLIVRGGMDGLVKARADLGVALLSDSKLTDAQLGGGDRAFVEALVPPNSTLIGETLKTIDFRRRYGAFVLAIRHSGETLRTRLAQTPLRFGDTLLLVGPRDRVEELRERQELVVTSELDLHLHRHRLWWLVLLLLPLAMGLAAAGVVEIVTAAAVACIVLLVVGAITPREAYRSVDWSVVFFIAAFVPVGSAMFNTGASDYLADLVLAPLAWLPPEVAPWAAISLLYLATSLVTEVVTNNASAIILTPVAMSMASELGVDPRPFIFAICFAASAAFMTPTGYQTNMMVFGPGGYRFSDYLRLGIPMNTLFWLVATLAIPLFWPFE